MSQSSVSMTALGKSPNHFGPQFSHQQGGIQCLYCSGMLGIGPDVKVATDTIQLDSVLKYLPPEIEAQNMGEMAGSLDLVTSDSLKHVTPSLGTV